MRRLINPVLLLVITLCSCKQPAPNRYLKHNKPGNYQVRIKIPEAWVEKLRSFDYTHNTKELLLQFEKFIKPDTLTDSKSLHQGSDCCRMLDPLFADVDGEPGEELICMLGWAYENPSLCVFKKNDGSWYLIYFENIYTFYNAPRLTLAGNFSKNKVFYFDHVDDHGSGIFASSYSFYKLINGKVYHCLELLDENHIYGWGLFLNQEVSTAFSFDAMDTDRLSVKYNYTYFPGAINQGDFSWDSHTEITMINGWGQAGYEWNDRKKIYELKIEKYQNEINDLTADKIACLNTMGDDTLFIKAFKRNIDTVFKIGTPLQKKLFRRYLKEVEKDKKATTHDIKPTAKVGDITFYGSQAKK